MKYNGKFCDLYLDEYYIQGYGRRWKYSVIKKDGSLIDAGTDFDTKNAARAIGRRKFYNREYELYEEYVKRLEVVEG